MPVINAWSVPTPINEFLQTSTGGTDATANYSTGAGGSSGVIFALTPTTGQVFRVEELRVHIVDTSTMGVEEYGNFAAFTNGVQVRIQTDTGTVNDLTDGKKVTTNAQWGQFLTKPTVSSWGSAQDFLSGSWEFGGYPLRVDGDADQRLEVQITDSCTGLLEHTFYAVGYQEDAAYDQFQGLTK